MPSPSVRTLATALRALTWQEMVMVSEYLSDNVQHKIQHKEPIDRDSTAELLIDLANDINREAEAENQGEPQ